MAPYNPSQADSQSLIYRSLKADEWHDTYLVDVARDHGIKRPSAKDVNWIRSRTKTIETAALLDPNQVRMVASGYPLYAGIPAPDWAAYSRFGPPRYCPHCLIDDGYFRARWRLTGYRICYRHRCFIKRDLGLYMVPGGNTPKFGKTPRQMSEDNFLEGTKYCTPQELRIHQAVWGDFEQSVCGTMHSTLERAGIGLQAAWSMLTWSLIERVARIDCHQLRKRKFLGSVENIVEFFQSNKLEVSASHAGVIAFFRNLKEYQTYAGGMRHIRRIDSLEKQKPSLVSRTDLEPLLQVILAGRPEIEAKYRSGAKCFVRDDQRGMSVDQFRTILGVSSGTANKWARLGLIRTEDRSNTSHSRLRSVPSAVVKTLLHLRRSLLTREEFCEVNALDEDTGHMLYDGGVLQTIEYAWCRYVTKESASNLMLKLELQCEPLDELETRFKWPLFGPEVKRAASFSIKGRMSLLEGALAGEVRLFRSLNRPGLSSFFVGVDGIAWLHRRVDHLRTRYLRLAAESAGGGCNLFQDH